MKITVQKYDPSRDPAPHDESYEIPWSEHMTLLQALVRVNEDCEELAFDYSCRGRTCGRCAMELDGRPVLACVAPLDDADHEVKPLRGFPVIRDLVVDKQAFHDKLGDLGKRTSNHTITWDEIAQPVDPHAAAMLDGIERCAHCGACMAACPVVTAKHGDYVGPAGMVAIAMRYYDPYDDGDQVAAAVSAGMWNCIMCGACDDVCPVGELDHIAIWTELREAAEAEGKTAAIGSALPFKAAVD